MKPADVVLLRDSLARWCMNDYDDAVRNPDSGKLGAVVIPGRILSNMAKLAELFYVSDDMTALVRASARTVVDFDLRPEDLPASHGLMMFAPDAGKPTSGLLWFTQTPTASDLPGEFEDSQWWGTVCPVVLDASGVSLGGTYPLVSGTVTATGRRVVCVADPGLPWGLEFLAATLLLSQPGVASTSQPRLDKVAAAKLRRRRIAPCSVRVVQLRYAVNPDAQPSAEQRAYHHRWLVRGHWRQQACGPGRVERKPIWITPHIKGPEGAPLLAGEKVYAWVR